MGLENFNTDNNSKSNDTESDNDNKDEDKDEETTTEEETKGLESFNTDNQSSDDEDSKRFPEDDWREEGTAPWVKDHGGNEWNKLSQDEKVKYVREHYLPNYRPNVIIDERWQSRKVNEVKCVCNNVFTFHGSGVCLNCGRTYHDAGRIVELKDEPQKE